MEDGDVLAVYLLKIFHRKDPTGWGLFSGPTLIFPYIINPHAPFLPIHPVFFFLLNAFHYSLSFSSIWFPSFLRLLFQLSTLSLPKYTSLSHSFNLLSAIFTSSQNKSNYLLFLYISSLSVTLTFICSPHQFIFSFPTSLMPTRRKVLRSVSPGIIITKATRPVLPTPLWKTGQKRKRGKKSQ